jgi:hypothetical protein
MVARTFITAPQFVPRPKPEQRRRRRAHVWVNKLRKKVSSHLFSKRANQQRFRHCSSAWHRHRRRCRRRLEKQTTLAILLQAVEQRPTQSAAFARECSSFDVRPLLSSMAALPETQFTLLNMLSYVSLPSMANPRACVLSILVDFYYSLSWLKTWCKVHRRFHSDCRSSESTVPS